MCNSKKYLFGSNDDSKASESNQSTREAINIDRTEDCEIVTESTPGPFVHEDVMMDDFAFLYAYLTVFGGEPTFACREKDGSTEWAVVSSCECDDCREYRKAVAPIGSSSVLRAARHYAVARSDWSKKTNTYH